jgi:hypothetical protein
MAAAKTVKVKLSNAAVILRDDAQVTLQAGEQDVSAAELKVLQAAGLVATDEPQAESEGDQ